MREEFFLSSHLQQKAIRFISHDAHFRDVHSLSSFCPLLSPAHSKTWKEKIEKRERRRYLTGWPNRKKKENLISVSLSPLVQFHHLFVPITQSCVSVWVSEQLPGCHERGETMTLYVTTAGERRHARRETEDHEMEFFGKEEAMTACDDDDDEKKRVIRLDGRK